MVGLVTTPTCLYAAVLAVALVPAVAGCAGQGSVEEGSASRAALAFLAEAGSRPSDACGLLAPETLGELEDAEGPCPRSLPQQHLPEAATVRRVEVYGKDAIVHLDGDTVFLARFDEGWRVTAAGCTAGGDRYDCAVKGG